MIIEIVFLLTGGFVLSADEILKRLPGKSCTDTHHLPANGASKTNFTGKQEVFFKEHITCVFLSLLNCNFKTFEIFLKTVELTLFTFFI